MTATSAAAAASADTTRSLSASVVVRSPNDMKIDPSEHGLIKYISL